MYREGQVPDYTGTLFPIERLGDAVDLQRFFPGSCSGSEVYVGPFPTRRWYIVDREFVDKLPAARNLQSPGGIGREAL